MMESYGIKHFVWNKEIMRRIKWKIYEIRIYIINQYLNGHPVPGQCKVAYISSIERIQEGISVTSTMIQLYGRVLNNLIEKEYSNF